MNELFLSFPFLKHLSFAEVKQALEMVLRSLSQDLRDQVKDILAILVRLREARHRDMQRQCVIDLLGSGIGEDDEAGRNALQSFEDMSDLNDQIATIQAVFSENSEHLVPHEIENARDAGASISSVSQSHSIHDGEAGTNEGRGPHGQGATQDSGDSLTYSGTTDPTVLNGLEIQSGGDTSTTADSTKEMTAD